MRLAGHRATWLFVSVTMLFLIIAGRASHRKDGALFVSDGFGYYIYFPSLIINGDLDLSKQLSHQEGQQVQQFYDIQPATSLPGNPFQVGCALLWLPFFLAAHASVCGLNLLGMNIPRDGFGMAYELPVYCGSFVYGLLGLYYTRKLLAELWGMPVSTMVTALRDCLASGYYPGTKVTHNTVSGEGVPAALFTNRCE
jgi:hypothetical protein